jgi:hypothetical protein
MGRACRLYGGRGIVYIEFWWKNLREKYNLEGLSVNGRILKRIFKKLDAGIDCIDLAQDMDRWREVLNAATNRWIIQNTGNYMTG